MSLINQVINQLEQRGAGETQELAMVRPVTKIARPRIIPVVILLAIVVLVSVLLWQWQKKSTAKNNGLPAAQQASPLPVTVAPPPATVATVTVQSAVAAITPVFKLSLELSPDELAKQLVAVEKPLSVAAQAPHPAAPPARKLAAQPIHTAAKLPDENPVTTASPATAVADPGGLPMKQVSPKQQAEAEFRKAVLLMQQGRIDDALAGYQAALNFDAGHDQARQALVQLLLENKRVGDAERVLQDAIKNKPEKLRFVMMEARLQVERGAVADGVATLERSSSYAGQQPDYQAFLAALLQRQERHKEAVEHYRIALQQMPNNGLWWMGEGISLQALQNNAEAKNAYQRALATQMLRPDLQAFVQQKLKEL